MTLPRMVAILAAVLDFTKDKKSSSSSSLLFIHGKNNQAKYTKYNILKMFTNYRINGNSIYKDARWNK